MVLILIFTYCKGMSWMTCIHGVWALRGNNISFYTRKHTFFHFLKVFFYFFFIRTKEILRKECNFRSWTTVPGLTWVPALGSFGMELCVVNSTDQTQAFLNDRLSCMTFWLTKRNFYAMLFFFFCFFYTGGESKMSPECALYKPSCHTLLTTRQNKALEHVLCAHIWFKKTWNDHASTFYTLCFSVLYYNIYYCIDCILFYKWGPCGGTVSFGFRIMSRVCNESGWLRLRCLSRAMELLLWLCNVRNRLSMLLQIMKLVQFIMK